MDIFLYWQGGNKHIYILVGGKALLADIEISSWSLVFDIITTLVNTLHRGGIFVASSNIVMENRAHRHYLHV